MNKLKELRQDKHYSRDFLASISGVNIETIKHIEDGTTIIEHCKLSTLIKLSIGLGCKVVDLLPNRILKYF